MYDGAYKEGIGNIMGNILNAVELTLETTESYVIDARYVHKLEVVGVNHTLTAINWVAGRFGAFASNHGDMQDPHDTHPVEVRDQLSCDSLVLMLDRGCFDGIVTSQVEGVEAEPMGLLDRLNRYPDIVSVTLHYAGDVEPVTLYVPYVEMDDAPDNTLMTVDDAANGDIVISIVDSGKHDMGPHGVDW